jgi:hypothetical protein
MGWDSNTHNRPRQPVTSGDKRNTSTPRLRKGEILDSPPQVCTMRPCRWYFTAKTLVRQGRVVYGLGKDEMETKPRLPLASCLLGRPPTARPATAAAIANTAYRLKRPACSSVRVVAYARQPAHHCFWFFFLCRKARPDPGSYGPVMAHQSGFSRPWTSTQRSSRATLLR